MTQASTSGWDALKGGATAAMRWVRAGDIWRPVFVSPDISTICGYDVEAFITGATRWEALIAAGDGVEPAPVETACGADGALTRRYRIRAKCGELRHIFDQTQVWRDGDGNLDGYSSALLDVTPLATGASDIGTLAYVSHEVRTPLTGIIGLAEALAQSPLTPDQRAVVDALSDAGASLLHLVNNMLEASRGDAGPARPDAAPFQAGALCAGVARLFAHRAAAKGLALQCAGGPEDPVLVGDQARLRQVLGNLVANAIKFTEAGSVRIRWSAAPAAADGGRMLRIAVSDDGVGMDAAAKARLFQPFASDAAGLAHDHAGAGLGLVISRDIMTLLGGSISVESAPGAGATFEIACALPETAPCRPRPVCIAPPSAADASLKADRAFLAAMRPSVLVADDVEANRRVIDMLLSPLGVRVTCVDNGVDAVAMAATRRFDAILLDGRMPGLTGVEATAEIRRCEACNGDEPAAIIAMSADGAEYGEPGFVVAGADGYLQKPFEPGGLVKAVASALRRAQAGQAAPPRPHRALTALRA